MREERVPVEAGDPTRPGMPGPLNRLVHRAKVSTKDALLIARMDLTPEGRRRKAALERFRDIHAGQRCIIIGNGPSLNDTNLDLLRGEVVFGLNRFYLMRERSGIEPTYNVAVNSLVIEQTRDDLLALRAPLFTTEQNERFLGSRPDLTYLPNRSTMTRFSRDVPHGIWEGATVTFVAMQLAYFMGFHEVVLVGVDHRFSAQGPAHQKVVSSGPDRDHFDPSYFGRGFIWQLPDLESSEYSYGLARAAFEKAGRRIVDCTVGGALTVFEKSDLESVLESR